MKERPILFSGPMVRAILDGRKTQTRRIVKPQPERGDSGLWVFGDFMWSDRETGFPVFPGQALALLCPYGQPGDRLWVRETWSTDFSSHYPFERVWYAADNDRKHDIEVRDGVRGIYSPESDEHVPFRWHPSIHMPRAASRITLEVTGVRVERLRDISEADAIAEGVDPTSMFNWRPDEVKSVNPQVQRYAELWDSLNAARGYGWDANPWVWLVEFRRIES